MNRKRNSRIPNTLEECTNTGKTVSDLYHYALHLEKCGKFLFVILIIVGIIFTVVETVSLIDVNEELIIPTLISSLLSWSFYAVIEFFVYHVLAMLIRALASITENTMITANIALWEASKKETSDEVVATPPENIHTQQSEKKVNPVKYNDGSWTCPNCGQKNLSTRTSCWRCDYQI